MTAILIALLLQSAYPAPPPHLNLLRALFSPIQQEPQHLPSHRMGPHEGEEGAWCYKGDTVHTGGRTLYNCPCKLVCEGMDIREQDDCETSCSPKGSQCLCHADEDTCNDPMVEPGK